MGYQPKDSGKPCWYECGAPDVDAACRFYESVLGWNFIGGGGDFDYRLARCGEHGVAGLMCTADQQDGPPPNWVFYVEVADADATAGAITAAGGSILMGPADIPGTGRFAVAADPQGAVFGILQPNPMDQDLAASAFDQQRTGHGNWHELSTSDLKGAMAFYSKVFGWEPTTSIDMGEFGPYDMFKAPGGPDLGGMMQLNGAPQPFWRPYFGVEGVDAAIQRVTDGGGKLESGPNEVPGGAWVAMFVDPQGARFGVVGPAR